ncbi:MAG TPA: cell division protein FtsA [Dehalococcoidia bacterium]|nr:cell division protein FtsA [Dehalococcoidia bacterium]
MKDNVLAAIDVGSSKICTLVAEPMPNGDVRVLGVGITPSSGVKKGMVDNIQEATAAIATSVERAEKSSGTRIISGYVSISGNHTTSLNNRGISTIPGRQRPITDEDIDRALEGARSLSLPTNREVLHSIARYFIVDGQEQVTDPVGMYGGRLDMDTHIVTGSVTAIQNLTQCVEGAGVQVEMLVFAPLAAGEAVLEVEEKEQGVILADIGGGTTDIAVYVDGSVFHTTVLPIGGYHLTHDLVAGLRAPFSHVEDLKLEHGACMPSLIDADEMVEIEAFGGQRTKEVPRRLIAEILQARCEEMLEMIYADVKRAGFDDLVSAGAVLTGGTAALPGLVELSEAVLRMPVRVGIPRGVQGLSDSLNGPAYATSIGLLRWAIEEEAPLTHNGNGNGHHAPALRLPAMDGVMGAAGKWLKTLIPK